MDGEPERDDYGLPPVDVVVPDDARELDREVLAYRRELRQHRRRERWQRLFGPFGRYGIAAPLIAGALVIALASATLLTVLTPRPAPRATGDPLADSPSVPPGRVGGLLPDITVTVTDENRRLRLPHDVHPAVIALVPKDCRCDQAFDSLAAQAREYSLELYLVAGRRPGEQLDKLAQTEGQGRVTIIEDGKGLLASTYGTAGLTALLVHTDGVVGEVIRHLGPGQRLEPRLERLQRPGQGAVRS